MAFQIYDNNFVYEDSRDIYVARTPLIDSERTRNAAKKAGIELRIMDKKFVVSPTEDQELEKLLTCLDKKSLGEKFKDKRSRILTLNEYDEMMDWANDQDKELYWFAWSSLEVLDSKSESGYVVNAFGNPSERENLLELKDYLYLPQNLNIGVIVREVLE